MGKPTELVLLAQPPEVVLDLPAALGQQLNEVFGLILRSLGGLPAVRGVILVLNFNFCRNRGCLKQGSGKPPQAGLTGPAGHGHFG